MEGREQVILDEEAAVDDLAKGGFWDKSKTINHLFKINNPSQNSPKTRQKAPKSG